MSVLIGHASIAETGGVYGQPGDQTGREVCTRSWWANGWDYMAIHPDPQVRERHARAVEAACANDCVGYSWDSRNTLYEQARVVGMDISRIRTRCNCDCSSLQNCAAVASGAPGVTYGDNGWVTTNMLGYLRAAGYAIITDRDKLQSDAYCVRGAIYVSSGHTICALGDGSRAGETLRAAGLTEEPTVVVIPDPVPVPSPDKPAETAYMYNVQLPLLRIGDKGGYVKAAQTLLIARGYSCGGRRFLGRENPDGEFGRATEKAVADFQRENGLEVDGEIGGATWAALINFN
jgi:hypothetical protein